MYFAVAEAAQATVIAANDSALGDSEDHGYDHDNEDDDDGDNEFNCCPAAAAVVAVSDDDNEDIVLILSFSALCNPLNVSQIYL